MPYVSQKKGELKPWGTRVKTVKDLQKMVLKTGSETMRVTVYVGLSTGD